MITLAAAGVTSVPYEEITRWSPARRAAAMIALGESRGGKFDLHYWEMRWPKGEA